MATDAEELPAYAARAVEDRVAEFWRRESVAARALAGPADGPIFRFSEGPPTANGPPHLGHLIARVLKDVQLRYRRLRGCRILRSAAGWDCHGLGVEIEIEKRFGLRDRKSVV